MSDPVGQRQHASPSSGADISESLSGEPPAALEELSHTGDYDVKLALDSEDAEALQWCVAAKETCVKAIERKHRRLLKANKAIKKAIKHLKTESRALLKELKTMVKDIGLVKMEIECVRELEMTPPEFPPATRGRPEPEEESMWEVGRSFCPCVFCLKAED